LPAPFDDRARETEAFLIGCRAEVLLFPEQPQRLFKTFDKRGVRILVPAQRMLLRAQPPERLVVRRVLAPEREEAAREVEEVVVSSNRFARARSS
jgi:hypothetical protein